jgi:DNA-binding NarL/FixJ family response regulator
MNIVIVEDHALIREAVRRACDDESNWHVLAETGSGREAIEIIVRLRPEMIVLDLGLDDLDGFEVADTVLQAIPSLRILVLSGRIDDYTVLRAGELGFSGFLDKANVDLAQIREALRSVSSGKNFYSPAFRSFRDLRQADPLSWVKILSETEQRVLGLIGLGWDDHEIGGKLNISPRTAQTHRSNILRKLGIDGTPKLVAFANQHGFTRQG